MKKCPKCKHNTHEDNMTDNDGEVMCEGCVDEMMEFEEYSDPLGMNWTNNPEG